MQNPMDGVYKDFLKKRQSSNDSGVPNPLFDSDMLDDKVRACNKCGSMNISVDLSSNELLCNDCKTSSNDVNKINFSKQIEEMQEEDNKSIEEAIRRGDRFEKLN